MSSAYKRSFDYFFDASLSLDVLNAETVTHVLLAPRTTLSARVTVVTGSFDAATVVNIEGWMPSAGDWVNLSSFSGSADTRHDVPLSGVSAVKMRVAAAQAGAATVKCEFVADVEQDRLPALADSVQHSQVKLYVANEQTDLIDVGRSASLKLYVAAQTWSTAVLTWEKSLDGLNWAGFDTPVTSSSDGTVELDVRGWRFVRGRTSTAAAGASVATLAAHADTNSIPPASAGSAPVDAAYVVTVASSALTAERVTTDTGTVTWDTGTAGQVKANVPDGAITEAKQTLADNTTQNVSSTKHGYAPKSPADATKFLNGAATPAYAAVKDSDLSTSDITTNDVTTSKHGFAPKAPNDTTKFLRGDAQFAQPANGTYTPTHTSVANLDSTPTSPDWHYCRVGDIVHVNGPATFDPTLGSALTKWRVSLPIASALANAEDLSGGAAGTSAPVSSLGIGSVAADVTNDEAEISWYNGVNLSSRTVQVWFSYRVK